MFLPSQRATKFIKSIVCVLMVFIAGSSTSFAKTKSFKKLENSRHGRIIIDLRNCSGFNYYIEENAVIISSPPTPLKK